MSILNGFQVIEGTKNTIVEFQRGITKKCTDKSYGSCALRCIWRCFFFVWSFIKMSLKGFRVIERTRNYHCRNFKGNNSKMYRQELQFLTFALRLMMRYISMKFHENILNGFWVLERIQSYHCRISKEDNSKSVWTRVTVFLCCARCLMSYISMKFHENILNGFRIIERTRNNRCGISNGNNFKTI